MTPDRIADLKALCEAATEGPWRVSGDGFGGDRIDMGNVGCNTPINITSGGGSGEWSITRFLAHVSAGGNIDERLAHAAMFAESRTAVPELIAEVERLQKSLLDERKARVEASRL